MEDESIIIVHIVEPELTGGPRPTIPFNNTRLSTGNPVLQPSGTGFVPESRRIIERRLYVGVGPGHSGTYRI